MNEFSFNYKSDGALIMGVIASPDGTICGGTAFPMRFIRYDPKTDVIENRAAYMQWNTVARQGDHLFVGGYPRGFLLDYDLSKPWAPSEKNNPLSNPVFAFETSDPHIHRPHVLLAHSDGKTLVMGATPEADCASGTVTRGRKRC